MLTGISSVRGIMLRSNTMLKSVNAFSGVRSMSKIAVPSSRRKRSSDPEVKAEIKAAEKREDEKWDIDFDKEVIKFMRYVNKGVAPMIPLNPGFAIHLEEEEEGEVPCLTIVTAKGKIQLTPDKEVSLLHLKSFLSGSQHYYFDAEERSWLSKRDRHSLCGIMTRDLIRHNRGVPNLDK